MKLVAVVVSGAQVSPDDKLVYGPHTCHDHALFDVNDGSICRKLRVQVNLYDGHCKRVHTH